MSESEYKPNIYTWCMKRELKFAPLHFVVSKAPITDKSKLWILEKLTGRFCIIESMSADVTDLSIDWSTGYPAFEDPKEAILYELTWG